MPLLKSFTKKSATADLKENTSGQSLAVATGVARRARAKKRKMADGGVVTDDSKKTVGQIIGFPGSEPVKKARGGMIEAKPQSIAEAIMRKRRMANGGEAELETDDLEDHDELDELEDMPEDDAPHSRVEAIRRKLRLK